MHVYTWGAPAVKMGDWTRLQLPDARGARPSAAAVRVCLGSYEWLTASQPPRNRNGSFQEDSATMSGSLRAYRQRNRNGSFQE